MQKPGLRISWGKGFPLNRTPKDIKSKLYQINPDHADFRNTFIIPISNQWI